MLPIQDCPGALGYCAARGKNPSGIGSVGTGGEYTDKSPFVGNAKYYRNPLI